MLNNKPFVRMEVAMDEHLPRVLERVMFDGMYILPNGQRVTFEHLRPDAKDHALDAGLLGLFGHRLQCLIERQPRMNQCRELASQQGKIGRRNTAPHGSEGRGTTLPAFLLRDFAQRDREEVLLPQELADLTGCVALENALAFAARGIDGCVFECAHVTG